MQRMLESPVTSSPFISSRRYMQNQRVFTGYKIYQDDGFMAIKMIPPTFTDVQSSTGTDVGQQMSRPGTILIEMAPIGNGPRQFDWDRKETFALSATECGAIIRLSDLEGIEFVHDGMNIPPSVQRQQQPIKTKRMSWYPTEKTDGMQVTMSVEGSDDPGLGYGSGYGPTMCSMALSWAEVEVVKTLLQFAIPRLVGFDKL